MGFFVIFKHILTKTHIRIILVFYKASVFFLRIITNIYLAKSISLFETNKELMKYLKESFMKSTFKTMWQKFLNKFRKPEHLVLLPPLKDEQQAK